MNLLAQTGVPIGTTFGSPLGQTKTIGDIVSLVLSNALVIAGVILLFLLVAGGIGMIAGAGSDNPEQLANGRKAITAAIIGFIIVFAAYWIIRLIESIIGVQFITAPKI
ncbi:hypothetical protein MUP46_01315 [Patescibacteria group bacterium]|nr:hypothetical protein [Patescibacteria group bacterium]